MSKKQKIEDEINEYFSAGEDSNHPLRRFFRCWIDGGYSYDTQSVYIKNSKDLAKIAGNKKKLISWVLSQFVSYIAIDYDCSISTVQRAIVESTTKAERERLNLDLAEDANSHLHINEFEVK